MEHIATNTASHVPLNEFADSVLGDDDIIIVT